MKQSRTKPTKVSRIRRPKAHSDSDDAVRVEVTVPATDANLMKVAAGKLRAGGAQAIAIRDALAASLKPKKAFSGKELIDLFRASPLVGLDLQIERERSAGHEPPV
jgi:hypothetical protein